MIALPHNQFVPTPAPLSVIEDQWLAETGCVEALWCGRGATALYWAFRVIRSQYQKTDSPLIVLIPAIVCQSVARAALLSGLTPRFVDVDSETGLLSLESVQEAWCRDTVAVVFVDLYGQTTDLSPFKRFCDEKSLVLIEDSAHALGGHYPDGSPVGSVADMTIFSFNRTKIIECGGGALLLKESAMSDRLKQVVSEPPGDDCADPSSLALLQETEIHLEKGLSNLFRLRAQTNRTNLYAELTPYLRANYIRPLSRPDQVAAIWSRIPDIVQERLHKGHLYHQGMSGGPWRFLRDWSTSGCSWRFSFLFDLPNMLLKLVDRIRTTGGLVSTLYWPLNALFGTADQCSRSEWFARRVLNVCVDHSVSREWVEAQAKLILEHGQSLQSESKGKP